MRPYDIIIVGAGISGLSFAHYSAKAGLKTLVIEKSNRAGGCIYSHKFKAGFWLELGAHTCYNSYANFIGIMEDLGLSPLKREKAPFKLLVNGEVKSIPFAMNFLELLRSAPRIFTEKKDGQTVESYYSKIAGEGNYKRVLGSVLSAVPSQKVDDFPAGMLFKKRKRRKDVIKKFTFDGGLQSMTDSILGKSGIEALTGIDVKGVSYEDGVFTLRASDDKTFQSRSLAMAAPPPAASALLLYSFPEVSSILSLINTTPVESVGVLVKRDRVSIKPFAGLFPLKDGFYSIVSRDPVPDEKYRGFSFHFKPGLSYEEKLSRIKAVLKTDFEEAASDSAVLPSPVLGHERLAGEIDRLLSGKRLFITGNYFGGLAIEDCVTRSLSEFDRLKGML